MGVQSTEKKKVFNFGAIALIVLFSVGFVSAGWFSDLFGLGNKNTITGNVINSYGNNTISPAGNYHPADTNQDFIVSGSEYNRILGFLRAGVYYCNPEGVDGYAIVVGNRDCGCHGSDLDCDWKISQEEADNVKKVWQLGNYSDIFHPADTNLDWKINMSEMLGYCSRIVKSEGDVNDLCFSAIGIWKEGENYSLNEYNFYLTSSQQYGLGLQNCFNSGVLSDGLGYTMEVDKEYFVSINEKSYGIKIVRIDYAHFNYNKEGFAHITVRDGGKIVWNGFVREQSYFVIGEDKPIIIALENLSYKYSSTDTKSYVMFDSCPGIGFSYDDYIQTNTTQSTCTDSDGGLNYYARGTTIGLTGSGVQVTSTDVCGLEINGTFDANHLNEFSCIGSINMGSGYDCPNGCVDGACVTAGYPTIPINSEGNCIITNYTLGKVYGCEYKGQVYNIINYGGCGVLPTNLSISYANKNLFVSLDQTSATNNKVILDNGVIITNEGAPCTVAYLTLHFDGIGNNCDRMIGLNNDDGNCGYGDSPSIFVIFPNDEQTINPGGIVKVKWNSFNLNSSYKVHIDLQSMEEHSISVQLTDGLPSVSTETYYMSIPADIIPGRYRILVIACADGCVDNEVGVVGKSEEFTISNINETRALIDCDSIGLRKDGKYCSPDKLWVAQIDEGKFCENHFECLSYTCVSNECVSVNLIQKILNWFKNLFG